MLIHLDHQKQPSAKNVWLAAVEPASTDVEANKTNLETQIKRLRRMQSQNFIQRAAHAVVELFSSNAKVA
jgi:hypothetical protein